MGRAPRPPLLTQEFGIRCGPRFNQRSDSRSKAAGEGARPTSLEVVLAALERLQRFERPRPVRFQQPGQTAIGQKLPTGLAARTVVGFVVRVANALDLFAASWARLSIASVDRHFLTKRSHLFRKISLRLRVQLVYPEPERVPGRGKQPFAILPAATCASA